MNPQLQARIAKVFRKAHLQILRRIPSTGSADIRRALDQELSKFEQELLGHLDWLFQTKVQKAFYILEGLTPIPKVTLRHKSLGRTFIQGNILPEIVHLALTRHNEARSNAGFLSYGDSTNLYAELLEAAQFPEMALINADVANAIHKASQDPAVVNPVKLKLEERKAAIKAAAIRDVFRVWKENFDLVSLADIQDIYNAISCEKVHES